MKFRFGLAILVAANCALPARAAFLTYDITGQGVGNVLSYQNGYLTVFPIETVNVKFVVNSNPTDVFREFGNGVDSYTYSSFELGAVRSSLFAYTGDLLIYASNLGSTDIAGKACGLDNRALPTSDFVPAADCGFFRVRQGTYSLTEDQLGFAGVVSRVTVSWSETAPFGLGLIGVTTSIPEPASWAMMLVGLGLLGGAIRYRGDRAAARASSERRVASSPR